MEPNHLIKFNKVWLLNSSSVYVACWGIVTTSILGNFPYTVMTTWKKKATTATTNKQIDLIVKTTTLDFFILSVHFIPSLLQCKWLTVICKTTWNEMKWKSLVCEMKICFKKWWQKVATWMPCCLDRKNNRGDEWSLWALRIFCKHEQRYRICFASSKHFFYFPLAAILLEILFKIKQKIF